MTVTFDGTRKLVVLDSVASMYTDVEIYSRWKDWVLEPGNAKYLPAFAGSVGGEDAGGGEKTPVFIFVRNDTGWRIKKPEANISVEISGNLLPIDPAQEYLQSPDGAFEPVMIITRSNVSNVDIGVILDQLAITTGHARAANVQTQPS